MWRLGCLLVTAVLLGSFFSSAVLIDGKLSLVAAQPKQEPQANTKPSGLPALPADANQAPVASDTTQTNNVGERRYATTKTPYEFYLAMLTIVLGVAAMLVVGFLFRNHIHDKTDEFVKLFAFVIVVFSAIYLIIAGYTDSQVAPAYSLLGTIIGYIFGREGASKTSSTAPGSSTTPPTST